jgi:hypothetical protein
MRLNQIEDLLRSMPNEDSAKELGRIIAEWRRGLGEAKDLITRAREALQRTRPRQAPHVWAHINEAWATFEKELSLQVRIMTPYELCRTFGLVDEFDTMASEDRVSLIDGLRVDPDSVKGVPGPHSGLTPEQLVQQQQWEHKQHQLRLREEQQFFHPQQDSMIAGLQAQARAPRPRKMLDRGALEILRKKALSRGVDLQSESSLTLQADNVQEAIQLVCLLSHERGCELFRGQPLAWDPIPAALRKSTDSPEDQGRRWGRFKQWAQGQEALASISSHQKKLAAVAQHYGLPTMLLDFSKNPRVAAFFATHTVEPPEAGPGCIYCLAGGVDKFLSHGHDQVSAKRAGGNAGGKGHLSRR